MARSEAAAFEATAAAAERRAERQAAAAMSAELMLDETKRALEAHSVA